MLFFKIDLKKQNYRINWDKKNTNLLDEIPKPNKNMIF